MPLPAQLPKPQWPEHARLLRFGRFCLDRDHRRLLRDGEPIELPARAFEVLQLLVASPHQLLTREAIFDAVWKDTIVEDANLTQVVWVLRRAFGDDAKSYIRTVARRGYVFEPPDPVVAETAAPSLRLASDAAPNEPPVVPVRAANARRYLLGTAMLASALVLAAAVWYRLASPATSSSVVIVETRDAADDEGAQNASALLHDWLRWKLGVLHQIDVADGGTAPAAGERTQRVILLSTSRTATGSEWQLDARVFGAGDTRHYTLVGADLRKTDALDAFSRRVAAVVAPQAEDDLALELTTEAAEHYAAADRARARGDRATQIAQLRLAQQEAPSAGWLRVQTADVLAELGQIRAANVEVERNADWTAALPPTARALLDARRLAFAQRSREAAAAYVDLARRYPHMAGLRLDQAEALVLDQRLSESAEALDTIDIGALSVDQRIRWLKLRTTYLYYQESPRAAQAAYRKIAELAGDSPRLALPRAVAEGNALAIEVEEQGAAAGADRVAALEAAADRVAAAGDPIEAAKLRVRAALATSDAGSELVAQRVGILLALTRANGDVARELWALWVDAIAQGRSGRVAEQRATLLQAEAVAKANDNLAGTRDAAKFLGQEELRAGRYDEAERRFVSVRGILLAPQIGLGLAALYTAQGRYEEAERAIEDANRVSRQAQAQPAQSAAAKVGIDCWLGTVRLARAQIDQAQALFANCATQSSPAIALQGRLGLAQVAAISGSREQAREQARALVADIAALTDALQRMDLYARAAQVLVDANDMAAADKALDGVVAFANRNGLAPLEARARSAAMQIALARGNDEDALADYAAADAVLPASDWRTRSRLDTLRAIAYRNAGDAGEANRLLDSIVDGARSRGDVVAELSALSIDDRDEAYARRTAQTGARGTSLRDLLRTGGNPR